MKLVYNSPIVLSIAIICTVLFVLDYLLAGVVTALFALPPELTVFEIYKTISYTLVHGSVEHLLGNLSIFLLVGPILEERYGPKVFLLMCVLTAVFTATLNVFLFDEYLIGLSGVVFMMVVLASFTNVTGDQIPLTFVFVIILFVGKEVLNSMSLDNVSQFAHIVGGVVGSFFGFYINKLRRTRAETEE
jgi:rhomboid protease GluP